MDQLYKTMIIIKGKVKKNCMPMSFETRVIYKTIILQFAITFVLSTLTSCIHDNCWHFKVRNSTKDTLVVTTETIIPDFYVYVNNYDFRLENEYKSEIYYMSYVKISDTIFVLPPNTDFLADKVWSSRDVISDRPETDGVSPGWKFIKRMELGGISLSPEVWNSEQKWKNTWKYEDVEREYSLIIDE